MPRKNNMLRVLVSSVASATEANVSFVAGSELHDVVVSIAPELEPYVRAEPRPFDTIPAGGRVELSLVVSAPLDASLMTFDGTLKLRRTKPDKRRWWWRSRRHTIAKPLPIVVTIEQAHPFEEYGSWNMPDPGLTDFIVEPERAAPGEPITLRATITNEGTGPLGSPDVVFLSDDSEIARVPLGPLGPGEAKDVIASWTAGEPGRHTYVAELRLEDGDFDRTLTNNSRTDVAFSSGEPDATPDLELGDVDFDALQLTASEPALIPLLMRNPSFATITDVAAFYYIDGQRISPPGGDAIDLPNAFITLAAGETQELTVPWNDVKPG